MRLNAIDADAEHARAMPHALRAEVRETLDIAYAFEKGSHEIHFVGRDAVDALIENPLHTFRQARDANRVVTAGFEAVGHEIWLPRCFAHRPGSALHKRCEFLFQSGPDVQESRPQRAEQPLVSRRGEQIDRIARQIDRQMSRRLRRVNDERNPMLRAIAPISRIGCTVPVTLLT